MRQIKYPLIVSDFDGTLVNKDGTICESNKKAISEYIAAGGAFAISTGRLRVRPRKGASAREASLSLSLRTPSIERPIFFVKYPSVSADHFAFSEAGRLAKPYPGRSTRKSLPSTS